jgi:hypothetical protein
VAIRFQTFLTAKAYKSAPTATAGIDNQLFDSKGITIFPDPVTLDVGRAIGPQPPTRRLQSPRLCVNVFALSGGQNYLLASRDPH